jgi:hypothetical protein
MDKFTEDAADALQQHEETTRRRTLFPPKPPEPLGKPWKPVMTEEERAAHERYVKDENLPF